MKHSEYKTIQTSCGFVDNCALGKLALVGPDAKSFLNGQVTNDVEALSPGSGCYAAFLTAKGKMLGDLRILDCGNELLLILERVALQELFDRIRLTKVGFDVVLEKRTLEMGCISLIGPGSFAVLEKLKQDSEDFSFSAATEEHTNSSFTIDKQPFLAVVSHLGIDTFCAAAEVPLLKRQLQMADVTEVHESTAEIFRVESGRPRYGIDLDETVIPQEAGLNDRAVNFQKGCYVGQETVARLFYRGKPNRHLRLLRLQEQAQTGEQLIEKTSERVVGKIGSVTCSPSLGWIGLALVRREITVGDEIFTKSTTGEQIPVLVEALPKTLSKSFWTK